MNRLYFIINPVAGGTRAKEGFDEVKAALTEMNFDFGFDYTTHKGHATELARAAAERGEKHIVSVGGDGTANEIVQGLLNTDAVMGILPFGTGNDLAKVLDIPNEPREALSVLLMDSPRSMDLGMMNGKLFTNVSGFGFDVDVLINTERFKKRFHGMIPYLLGIITSLASIRTLHLSLKDGEREWKKESVIISVGNGTHFGGGMKPCPFADPFDGLLDVCVIKKVALPKFLMLLPKFIKGEHTGLDVVEYFRTKELHVDCPEQTLINYDGELGSSVPVTFKVLPGAIKMLVK